MKRALFVFIVFFFLISIPSVFAGVGIGMGPTRLNIRTSIGNPYSATLIVYNPGDYDIKAKVTFECENCESDAYFFGWRIGKVREDYRQFFTFDPEEVYVPNHTGPEAAIPITVHITPSIWVKKELVISTPEEINFLVRGINPSYTGEFSIPYYTLLIDEKEIKGGITISAVWSTFGAMGATPAVGADLNMHIKGIPLGSLIIIILIIICVILFILWKIGFRRIYKFFKRKKKSK